MKIIQVESNSLGEYLGLQPGDRLLKINGSRVRDEIDTPMIFVVMAVIVSVATGMLSGVMPARRAASLDPIEALRTE